MPVTKKKGAIFAIYADSPTRTTRSTLPSTTSTTTSSSQPASKLLSSDSPSKKSQPSRKALSLVQPKPLGFPSEPSLSGKGKGKATDDLKSIDSKSSIQPSVNPKSTVRLNSNLSSTTTISKRASTLTAKRQFEIFRAPSPPSTSSPSTLPQTSKSIESPIKKTKSTPRKIAVYTGDKENASPSINDSPASRTRSKIRSMDLNSPVQPLRSRSGIEELVGDGKGTFTLKKGRTVGKILKDANVLADSVLVDVSEAYGAEGDEPLGFRTQRR